MYGANPTGAPRAARYVAARPAPRAQAAEPAGADDPRAGIAAEVADTLDHGALLRGGSQRRVGGATGRPIGDIVT